MNQRSRVVAAALTGAVTFGFAAPAATAAPHHAHTKSVAHAKRAVHVNHRDVAHHRVALHLVAVKDAFLARAQKAIDAAGLDATTQSTLDGSVSADRAALSALTDQINAGSLTFAQTRVALRQVHPENYLVAVGDLVSANQAQAQVTSDQNTVDALQTQVDASAAAGNDVSAAEASLADAQTNLADAQTNLADAVAKASAVTAETAKADLDAVETDLTTVTSELAQVQADIDAVNAALAPAAAPAA